MGSSAPATGIKSNEKGWEKGKKIRAAKAVGTAAGSRTPCQLTGYVIRSLFDLPIRHSRFLPRYERKKDHRDAGFHCFHQMLYESGREAVGDAESVHGSQLCNASGRPFDTYMAVVRNPGPYARSWLGRKNFLLPTGSGGGRCYMEQSH